MKSILPEGLTMRPPTMDDLGIAHELMLAHDLALFGEEDATLEDLRTYWTAPTHDLARDQRLVFAQAWAREQMAQAEPGVRVTLNTWAPSNNQDSLERYARMGLTEVRRYWHMQIEMSEAPAAPVWPEGVALRPFVPERDDRAVFEMIDAALNDHWGHIPGDFDAWRHRKIEVESFDPSLWFIAYEGEQIAGGSLCSDSAQSWVDTLGILRPWRRKGLGLALLLHSFGEFYRRGRRVVVLGVDSQNLTGAVRLYQRAGMHIARENISFEKELRAGVELSTQALAV
jgi:ribosomal protein S18 acetylase RimI-like enzyme